MRDTINVKATCLGTNMNRLGKWPAIQSQPVSCLPHRSFMERTIRLRIDFQNFSSPGMNSTIKLSCSTASAGITPTLTLKTLKFGNENWRAAHWSPPGLFKNRNLFKDGNSLGLLEPTAFWLGSVRSPFVSSNRSARMSRACLVQRLGSRPRE